MANPEQVVIDIIAENHASAILNKVASDLQALKNVGINIGNVNIPTVPIVNDVNLIKDQISIAQKALNSLKNSPNKELTTNEDSPKKLLTADITPPKNLQEANNLLDKLRANAQKGIKINIDKGNTPYNALRKLTEESYSLNGVINKVRENINAITEGSKLSAGSQGLAGKQTGFQLVGMPYDPTKLLGSGEGKYGNNEIIKTGGEISKVYDNAGKSASNFAKASQDAGKLSYSSFHQLNNMMVVVGGTFNDLGTKIAGIFGAAGLSGMIQKMWEGASQRQQNMMYLMHQKGTEQANKYYDEIMDIVTKLPGDDTFLTNILNMSSALDKSLKLDNLKEAGTAITDYYMAATMKGENSYETQKDIRKYITTGDTRGMRNSVLASEIDSLKEKKNVLERIQALQSALDKTGFKGMSEYESATNELEEFKGHFQKAFADLGMIIVSIVQPLMNFYNTLDSIFGSRISQLIIIMATALVALFTTIGGGLILVSSSFRMIETITLAMEGLSFALNANITRYGLFNTLLVMSIGEEKAKAIATDGNVAATMRDTIATAKNNIARAMGITVTEGQTVSTWQLILATLSLIKAKIVLTFTTIRFIYTVISDIIWTWRNTDAKLSEAIATKLDTLAEQSNAIAKFRNTLMKIRGIAVTIGLIGLTIVETIQTWLNTDATLKEASAHAIDAIMKTADAEATFGLATATAFLEATLAPLIIPLLIIVGVILAIIIAVEKLGEAFGWWKDFGSMIQAIGDGISRLWNAFVGSDVIQGIIQYFQNFVASVQYVFECVSDFFNLLFGGGDEDNGTFDIIQSIIDIFGRLGETIKWVWDFIDDMVDNNPIINLLSWMNPLSILIFHLDEIGSLFEDIGDAIGRFTETEEFIEMQKALGEAWEALQEPFQEIWSLIQEIMDLIGEAFGSESDPVGRGTEERINAIVEVFKAVAWVVKNVVAPVIRGLALVIRIVLTPLRLVLSAISFIIKALQGGVDITKAFGDAWAFITKPLSDVWNALKNIGNAIIEVNKNILNSFIGALQWVISQLGVFGKVWEYISIPISYVWNILKTIGGVINQISNSIKKSFIGKLFGWDKEDNDPNNSPTNRPNIPTSGYGQYLTSNNVNNINNLGRSYNNTNNQRNVVINQNFSEGSMPIDARNMTKKEAKKMFIGAFGYNRSVGSRGILR